ncbi:MAG: C39 family peptidase [Thermoleophilia bacterium]|nr:C39 family peptidase [Thermoleophilia bacterium]
MTRMFLLVTLALLAALAVAGPAAAAETSDTADLPPTYMIEDVPLWQQLDASGCGAASAEIVMDYWGPLVDQREIYAAARTGRGEDAFTASGTAVPDLAHAGQFSLLSETAGDAYDVSVSGYTARPLGYGAFYYGAAEPWLDQLKAVIAAGYPVICLTDWMPDIYGYHYRVVVGYDDARGVLYFHDPWVRWFTDDIGARGCFVPTKAASKQYDYQPMEWSYEDWLAVWDASGDLWGQPGYGYNAVLIAPWHIEIQAPETVAAGETFAVTATVTYPCMEPFASEGWPAFPASATTLELAVPAGWSADGAVAAIGDLDAGASASRTFTVTAGAATGEVTLGAIGSGLVSGSLAERAEYPAYDYTDLIGGSGEVTIAVTD